jgi:hypothetical protein
MENNFSFQKMLVKPGGGGDGVPSRRKRNSVNVPGTRDLMRDTNFVAKKGRRRRSRKRQGGVRKTKKTTKRRKTKKGGSRRSKKKKVNNWKRL